MKTPEMERIELRDWTERLQADPTAPRRDIREIIQDAFDAGGTQIEAAKLLGVTNQTLSLWMNRHLGGDVRSRAVFPEFQPADPVEVA